MDAKAKELVNQGMPWKPDANWLLVAIEALALIVLGVFILLAKDTAADVILQLIGVVLLAMSFLLAWEAFRNTEKSLGLFDAFRAGVGVTAGMIATVSWWSGYIDDYAVRLILGWSLVAYSLLHLAGLMIIRGRGEFRVAALVVAGLTLVLGVVLLTSTDTTSDNRLNLLGWIVLIFGVLLAGLSYYLYSRAKKANAPTVATGA